MPGFIEKIIIKKSRNGGILLIISASRRTDIPCLYSEWFFNRISEGFVKTRNPVNKNQITEVSLKPDDVSGFVFWTKNPGPMMKNLKTLADYEYYFQFTLTPYGDDIEPNLPDKKIIGDTFKALSGEIGADRVMLRYDPVLLNDKYDFNFHIDAFGKMLNEMKNYTKKVTISFIDEKYRGVRANVSKLRLTAITDKMKIEIGRRFAETAAEFEIEIVSCACGGLENVGIKPASCVDASLFTKTREKINFPKDKNQRPECGCAVSKDIGAYNTCVNGCLYCYANYMKNAAVANFNMHDPGSPALNP